MIVLFSTKKKKGFTDNKGNFLWVTGGHNSVDGCPLPLEATGWRRRWLGQSCLQTPALIPPPHGRPPHPTPPHPTPAPVLHTPGPLGSWGVWNQTRTQGFRYFRAEGQGWSQSQKFLHRLLSPNLLCSILCPQERLTLFLPQYETTSGP